MARIPDEEIERLKKEVALEPLVLGFGVELKRHGAELLGRCPFHAAHPAPPRNRSHNGHSPPGSGKAAPALG
jgi:hypothetical protein